MCKNCMDAWNGYNAAATKLILVDERAACEASKTWEQLVAAKAARAESMKSVDEFLFRVKENCPDRRGD